MVAENENERDRHDWRELFLKITELLQQRWQQNSAFILKILLPRKQFDESFTNPTSAVELQLLKTWLLKTTLKGGKAGVMTIKPECLMNENTYYGQMSSSSRWSQHQSGFMFGEPSRNPIILKTWFQLWNIKADLWRFGQKCTAILLVL